jgi:light-regulated signal transduction histidine kinase (bacteriophytochrome)
MGGVDYIYKPINPDLLRVKVSVFVELYRKNRQLQQQESKLLSANSSLQKEIEDRKLSEEKIQHLNQQLIENNAHLKQMNEELDQFAYMASHDLQEPLRKIQMFSDKIMVKKDPDEETTKYFSKIISASRRMQSLINNLLDFSRHSVRSSDFKKTDLNQLLKETLNELELDIEKSGAKIHIGNLPEIAAVPGLMQQLFYNLLSNAVKFRKKAVAPVIDINAAEMTPEEFLQLSGHVNGSIYYKITVTDNGIGFDEQYSEDIFKVFKRLHSYQQYEGTGVGLSICKKIVEQHGGFIRARSAVEKGSTFIIGLPATQPRPSSENTVNQPARNQHR